jgi:hypothetical protein
MGASWEHQRLANTVKKALRTQVVDLDVAGSSPVSHPFRFREWTGLSTRTLQWPQVPFLRALEASQTPAQFLFRPPASLASRGHRWTPMFVCFDQSGRRSGCRESTAKEKKRGRACLNDKRPPIHTPRKICSLEQQPVQRSQILCSGLDQKGE